MIKKAILSAILIWAISFTYAQDKPAYVIYNAKGKKVSYAKMLQSLIKNDVVLFGELHNNPIAHWLEYELAIALNKEKPLILGAEMLEADNQKVLDTYLKGNIESEEFTKEARLWPNYATDYAPLVNFAKEKELPFIATNIPRKYASLVYKKDFIGLDSLSSEEKAWIAPLPIAFDPELPTYKNILSMMGGHGSELLVKAQAIKDATMAHFILKNYQPNHIFLHYNGAYHSDDHEGILWYLQREKPLLKYITISTVSQDNINKLAQENLNKADFVICVDGKMTTTY